MFFFCKTQAIKLHFSQKYKELRCKTLGPISLICQDINQARNSVETQFAKNERVLASEHVKIGQDPPILIFLTVSLVLLLFLMQNQPNYQTVQAVWLGVCAQNLDFRVKFKPYFEHTQKIGHRWPQGAKFLDGKSQYHCKKLFYPLEITFYKKWEGPGLLAKKQARTL